MGEIFRFARKHLGPILGLVFAAISWGYGVISGAHEIATALLEPWQWQLVGGAVFLTSVLAILFHWDRNQPVPAQFDRLPTARGNEDAPNKGVYEGAHERLMLFVVGPLFDACYARHWLHGEIISALCQNGLIAELARSADLDELYGLDQLSGLSNSPAEYIDFPSMVEGVSWVEQSYEFYCRQAGRLAQTGYVREVNYREIARRYEAWRIAHNAMVEAYEAIKRDSKMGKLFRPARESRWGGLMLPFTGAVPLPLMLREPEESKQQ